VAQPQPLGYFARSVCQIDRDGVPALASAARVVAAPGSVIGHGPSVGADLSSAPDFCASVV